MKFSITQPGLVNLLEKVAKLRRKNNQGAPWEGVFIEVKDGKATFAGTNLVTSVRTWTTVEGGEDGVALVPVLELLDAAKTARKNTRIDLEANDNNLRFSSGTTKLILNGFDPDDFPKIPTSESTQDGVMVDRKLIENIADVVAPFADSANGGRPILECVCMSIKDGNLSAFCADGFLISGIFAKISLPDQEIHIDAESFKAEIAPAFVDSQIKMSIHNNSVIFSDSCVEISTQQIAGAAPDFSVFFKNQVKSTTTKMDSRELMDSLKRLGVVVEDKSTAISLEFVNQGELVLEVQTQKGTVSDTIQVQTTGDDAKTRVNLKYLQKVLTAVGGEIEWQFVTVNNKPMIHIFSKDIPGLSIGIMPLKKDGEK